MITAMAMGFITRRIWVPRRMYDNWPKVCVVLGSLFFWTCSGFASALLSLLLCFYGGLLLCMRW